MNLDFQRHNIEDVLFIDIENVRRSKELEIDSEEYSLYQWKRRDRDTDELLSDKELQEDYARRGALVMGYSKIVTIGIGIVRDGVPYIKALVGTEEEIIKEFCELAKQFRYVCGANIIAYDLPVTINNGWRYFNVSEILPDRFVTSGKKPWNLGSVIDLLEMFKGSHYYMSSVGEVCYHFGIPTPKDGISGADVSRVYYEGGLDQIAEYCKKDILANINIFLKMQNKEIFTDFVDRSDVVVEDTRNILQKFHAEGGFTEDIIDSLEEVVLENKPTKGDWKNIQDILYGVYVNDDFINMNQDTKAVKEEKEVEVENIIEHLKEVVKENTKND